MTIQWKCVDDEKQQGGRGHGRQRTVTREENDEAMKLAMQKYKVATVLSPDMLKPVQPKNQMKRASKSKLDLLDAKSVKIETEFAKLEEKQQNFTEKLKQGAKDITDDQLKEHALDLQILYTEQQAIKSGMEDAISIVTDYLRDDGREALIKFFQVKFN